MKSKKMMAMVLGLAVASSALACSENGKDGFLPENDLYIPANQKSINGISEEEFNQAIDEVEEIYAPIISNLGAKLNIERKWDDGTVNAYASQAGKTWKVAMFGGLARHATITKDAMALVVCHEIGHHIQRIYFLAREVIFALHTLDIICRFPCIIFNIR
jgi:Zn-dependent protease with chaperone function